MLKVHFGGPIYLCGPLHHYGPLYLHRAPVWPFYTCIWDPFRCEIRGRGSSPAVFKYAATQRRLLSDLWIFVGLPTNLHRTFVTLLCLVMSSNGCWTLLAYLLRTSS